MKRRKYMYTLSPLGCMVLLILLVWAAYPRAANSDTLSYPIGSTCINCGEATFIWYPAGGPPFSNPIVLTCPLLPPPHIRAEAPWVAARCISATYVCEGGYLDGAVNIFCRGLPDTIVHKGGFEEQSPPCDPIGTIEECMRL